MHNNGKYQYVICDSPLGKINQLVEYNAQNTCKIILLLPVLTLPLPEKVQRYLNKFNVTNVFDRTHKRILSILKTGALELMGMNLRIQIHYRKSIGMH